MGYAFTDVRAPADGVRALIGPRAVVDDARARNDVRAPAARRPASAPHAGRPVRRDP